MSCTQTIEVTTEFSSAMLYVFVAIAYNTFPWRGRLQFSVWFLWDQVSWWTVVMYTIISS